MDPQTIDRVIVQENPRSNFVYDLVMTTEGLELASIFPKVDRRHRRLMVEMARALSESTPEAGQVHTKVD